MVLTKDTSQVTTREENRSTPIPALDTRFFPKMRRDNVDFNLLSAYQAVACGFVAVYAAEAGAEVAVAQMGIRARSLLSCIY